MNAQTRRIQICFVQIIQFNSYDLENVQYPNISYMENDMHKEPQLICTLTRNYNPRNKNGVKSGCSSCFCCCFLGSDKNSACNIMQSGYALYHASMSRLPVCSPKPMMMDVFVFRTKMKRANGIMGYLFLDSVMNVRMSNFIEFLLDRLLVLWRFISNKDTVVR